MKILHVQLLARKNGAQYRQERAKNQSSVITLKDTHASFEDSDTMKTIAAMTMFFLAVTFATLFAAPMLDWTDERVGSDHF
ncbi:hypothetical protein PFICI_06398 [Pestalotiopsis fici W106-1]|uniref:Uncharacterized protein n=1 Tax=Pestalotiopsis fici (strain W106-1 / CGMCC3.15140) TaxID=1229662 RepID=W3X881_PESFW|nr:uncharacterized protein PFICI_06398 [Pestalotiopsis fici W106-1]ETS81396.1 hypothetical protein PFICI_06398 [Pestalotiopsis fici W106-1]